MLLEKTSKFRVNSEDEARALIDKYRKQATEQGYLVKKTNAEYKVKKAKGEIIAQCWVVTITQVFGTLWEELE